MRNVDFLVQAGGRRGAGADRTTRRTGAIALLAVAALLGASATGAAARQSDGTAAGGTAPRITFAPTEISATGDTAIQVTLEPQGTAIAAFILSFKVDPATVRLVSLLPGSGVAPSGDAGAPIFSFAATFASDLTAPFAVGTINVQGLQAGAELILDQQSYTFGDFSETTIDTDVVAAMVPGGAADTPTPVTQPSATSTPVTQPPATSTAATQPSPTRTNTPPPTTQPSATPAGTHTSPPATQPSAGPTTTPTAPPVGAVGIKIGSASGNPGDIVTVDATLVTNGNLVAGAENVISFGDAQIVSCVVDPSITESPGIRFRPSGCPGQQPCDSVKLLLIDLEDLSPFPDGSVLYSCEVQLPASNGCWDLGCSEPLTTDPEGVSLETFCTGGTVCAGATPTATPGGPTECTGDCNGDGEVTINELITMVNIALENSAVSQCPAGDLNVDGQVTINEIIHAIVAALGGC